MAGRSQEPARGPGNDPGAVEGKEVRAVTRPTLEEARRQSAVLHTAMHTTLQAVHHRYYREDEGLQIPAATLKEVFADLENEHQVTLRWLVVEGQAMNSDHKARSSFEKDAVAALKAGKKEFERAENGVYRRAGAITLTNLCLKCHVPDRKSTKDRTAGLIISIPIEE
ncbi:DUF3365 domain-containing protein [Isosphaeraceae bacterium EP7]